jgi:hypothetical protein
MVRIILSDIFINIYSFETEICTVGDLQTHCFVNNTIIIENDDNIFANDITIETCGQLICKRSCNFFANKMHISGDLKAKSILISAEDIVVEGSIEITEHLSD